MSASAPPPSSRIKRILTSLSDLAMAGFLFLMPVYVIFIIATKAWTSLSSVGTKMAAMFGMKSIFGVNGSTVISGLLLIGLWIACGLLVRISLISAFQKGVEDRLASFIPGYSAYKSTAEEKLNQKRKVLPYRAALIRRAEYWQPAYVVEQDANGNYVVFLPNTPDTGTGHLLVATADQVRLTPWLTAGRLDGSLKKMGKGLVTELDVARAPDESPVTSAGRRTLPNH